MQNSLTFLITLVFGFDLTCGQNVKCSAKLQQHMAVNAISRFAFSLLLFGPHPAILVSFDAVFFDIFHEVLQSSDCCMTFPRISVNKS